MIAALRVLDLLDSLNEPKPARAEAAAILTEAIPQVQDSSPVGEGYDQARRVLSAAVHHDLEANLFDQAAEYGAQLTDLRNGADLEHLFGPGCNPSRDYWGDYLTDMVSLHIGMLVSGIHE